MIIPGFYPGSAIEYSQGFIRPGNLSCGNPPFSSFFFYIRCNNTILAGRFLITRRQYNTNQPVSDNAAAIQYSPTGSQ